MSKILISYRREDSAYAIDRIDERLVQEFGRQAVFLDVDSIPHGVDFRKYLDEQVAKCEVFLAVIGPDWMGPRDSQGKTRLEDPGDFVRLEVESALKRQIPVIPVFVRGASIPPAQQLPTTIQDLAYRHGLALRSGADFRNDMNQLIASLKRVIQGQQESQKIPGQAVRAVGEDVEKAPSAGRPSGNAPADMVKVPKGPFLYGHEKTRETIDHDYWIDRYPVTNKKYRAFIKAGGYKNRQYWSDDGWKWKVANSITGPAYWNDVKWNKGDHPVVGVSYYEAEAYATWAGKRLPTEQEWEKAARGEDGRQYPWGEGFDENLCNSSQSGIGHTTPVTQYPNGVSPHRCYDMAGNVWEWCADRYDGHGQRAIRGGSWNYEPVYLRASARLRYSAVYRLDTIGFRLAQDIEP
ncbi:MAG: SUMF1/EgtB/PvdO family nonheme iron enzyme [Nitrospira sp.]|nr:SUMF1/EgtB/PvdO family nonheme iron enzyme [Nitrospira sp.]